MQIVDWNEPWIAFVPGEGPSVEVWLHSLQHRQHILIGAGAEQARSLSFRHTLIQHVQHRFDRVGIVSRVQQHHSIVRQIESFQSSFHL